ncbi:MAG: hypothetical protein ACI814_003753 [Mariniblastus sp.]|jgi:hypothetical protein
MHWQVGLRRIALLFGISDNDLFYCRVRPVAARHLYLRSLLLPEPMRNQSRNPVIVVPPQISAAVEVIHKTLFWINLIVFYGKLFRDDTANFERGLAVRSWGAAPQKFVIVDWWPGLIEFFGFTQRHQCYNNKDDANDCKLNNP